jgi:hypothetical protein
MREAGENKLYYIEKKIIYVQSAVYWGITISMNIVKLAEKKIDCIPLF